MLYDNFDLSIVSTSSDRFEVHATGGEGETTAPVVRPIDRSRSQEILLAYRAEVVRGSRILARTESEESSPDCTVTATRPLREIGRELFDFLFPPEVAALWQRCRGRASEGGRGLRLRVHADLRRPSLAWVAALPWETLRASGEDGFVGLDGKMPIVRYLDMARGRRPFPQQRSWRVLVLMPEPYGLPRLDVVRERDDLLELWQADDRVELVFPDRCTVEDIQRVLRRQPVEGVHFMGHGTFDERTGDGGVILERDSGRPVPVTGNMLRLLVQPAAQPPALWVLNGCQTGWNGCEGGEQAFGGAAAALLRGGAAAVVAMQLPIADREAIHFSRTLHVALQDGAPIDRAVSEARYCLHGDGDDPSWTVPSLYMRVDDGRIFETSDAENAVRVGEESTPAIAPALRRTTDLDFALEELEDTAIRQVVERGRPSGDDHGAVSSRMRIGRAKGGRIEQVGRDFRGSK